MTVPAATAAPSTTGTSIAPIDTGDIVGFEVRPIDVAGEELLVAVADSSGARARGLMNVERFGDIDGMLFVFDEPTTGAFWMRDTLVPLDIGFFDEQGRLVQVLEMVPCPPETPDAECDRYRPGAPYLYALERPAGALADLPDGAVLVP